MSLDDTDPDEYLAAAKERALAHVDTDRPHLALASLMSDLMARPEMFASEIGTMHELGIPLAATGNLSEREQMRRFIEGFGGPSSPPAPLDTTGTHTDTTREGTVHNG